jgi:glucosamine--fructose-6-phosphate aminotransferase (isomerizing)
MSDFYKEIQYQPEALQDLVKAYTSFNSIDNVAKIMLESNKVVFSGMGSSYFAPDFVFSDLSRKINVNIIEAGELLHYNMHMLKEGDLLILISQSGESVEVQQLVKGFKDKVKIVGITNEANSTLGKGSDILLLLHSGSEKSVSNKSYTNTLAVLYMIAQAHELNLSGAFDALQNVSTEMRDLLNSDKLDDRIKQISDFLYPCDTLHFIGRGPQLANIYQSALIYMEGAKIYTHGFSSGAFRHGPLELSINNHRSIVFSFRDKNYSKFMDLTKELSGAGAKVVLLDNGHCKIDNTKVLKFSLDQYSDLGYNFLAIMVIELVLIKLAARRGYTAGVFEIGQKVTLKD